MAPMGFSLNSLADFGLTLEAGPFCRRKSIDLTNITKLVELHSLLPYSYGCVPVVFEYRRS
jgi:hypothetical protein